MTRLDGVEEVADLARAVESGQYECLAGSDGQGIAVGLRVEEAARRTHSPSIDSAGDLGEILASGLLCTDEGYDSPTDYETSC